MKRLKGVLDGLRPGSSAFQSSKDKSEQHSALDTAPDAPANAADIDTVQEQLRPEHFKLAKVNSDRLFMLSTFNYGPPAYAVLSYRPSLPPAAHPNK